MSLGLLAGCPRYRTNSTGLTIALHDIKNLAATIQTFCLAGPGRSAYRKSSAVHTIVGSGSIRITKVEQRVAYGTSAGVVGVSKAITVR